MELFVQYPDLTECYNIGYEPVDVESIGTEFAFGVAAPGQRISILKEMGFEHVSSMNNWWPTHKGQDRELKLMWRKLEGRPNNPAKVKRLRWGYGDSKDVFQYISKDLAYGGCGFKIAQPPLKRASFYRFFTLLRMPLQPTKVHHSWLKMNHFRLLDTGTLATFWCNGWDPNEWNIKKEREFFKDFKDEKYEALSKGY